MLVRDAMNPVTVTIGPSHTIRDAARRMMAAVDTHLVFGFHFADRVGRHRYA